MSNIIILVVSVRVTVYIIRGLGITWFFLYLLIQKYFLLNSVLGDHASKLTKFVILVSSAFMIGAKRNKLDIKKNGDIEVGVM